MTVFADPGGAARPLPALGLASDPSVLTALANDVGPEVVFARQIAALGGQADIAVGLSTSGNSENLLRAFDAAAALGMLTIGIAGYHGGRMAELDSIDYLFVAPSASVHRIQEAQTTMYHALWELARPRLGARAGGAMTGRTLVAGIGNIFLGDDGFGLGGRPAARRRRPARRGDRDRLRHPRHAPGLRPGQRVRRGDPGRCHGAWRRSGHDLRDRARPAVRASGAAAGARTRPAPRCARHAA